MNYVVVSKDNKTSHHQKQSIYTELGWEIVTTHLEIKKLYYDDPDSFKDTTVVCCHGREFLYNKILKTISYSAFKLINNKNIEVKDLTNNLEENLKKYSFSVKDSIAISKKELPQEYENSFNLISVKALRKVFGIADDEEITCATYRKRNWHADRNADDNFVNTIKFVAKKNKCFVVGLGAEAICDGKNIIHVTLQEYASLLPITSTLIATATGTSLIAHILPQFKGSMYLLDFDECYLKYGLCIHFMPQNKFSGGHFYHFKTSKQLYAYFLGRKLDDNYIKLPDGTIKQEKLFDHIMDYNQQYVDQRYNSYGELSKRMSYLRYGYMVGEIQKVPKSILDVGYGNGDFLALCSETIPLCYGNDVSGYPLPDRVSFVEDITNIKVEVTCFFDVLEHFPDISFVRNLKTEYVYISIPQCHYFSQEWFMNWKHRRPDEHLFHFNEDALVWFFHDMGYDLVDSSNIEDVIRKPYTEGVGNILTCIFKKRTYIRPYISV